MIRPWTDPLIAFLNELAKIDPRALRRLIDQRVPCNEALADHPSVQVDANDVPARVGLLGILNGFCGTVPEGEREGWGPIAAVLADDGVGLSFRRTVPDERRGFENLDELLEIIRQLLGSWFEKGRKVTADTHREVIPLEPKPGDVIQQYAKGDLVIVIRGLMP